MKILVVETNADKEYYDISSPEREAVALLRVFDSRNEDGCYEDMTAVQRKVLREDTAKLKAFLLKRDGYELEGLEFVEPINALV